MQENKKKEIRELVEVLIGEIDYFGSPLNVDEVRKELEEILEDRE